MSAPPVEPVDLLDLKFLPAWVKEPGATNHYDHYTGEEAPTELRGRDRDGRHKDRAFRSRERRGQTRRPGSKPDRRHRGRTPKAEGDQASRFRSSERSPFARTALRRLRQSRSRERFVFSRVRTYSKMWLRRSSPARLPIRCLLWRVCSWKNRGDMKFVSRQRPKRRFINLARTAESPWTGNSSSETHSGSPNATFTRSML